MKIDKRIISKSLPPIVAILVFVIISSIYFSPQLKGYLLKQSDIDQFLGMSKEISDFREKYDSEPLWTNSMFAGMPAYQISTKHFNIVSLLKDSILKIIPRPIGYMFFLMLGFYILLLCFDVNPWLAMIGAIVFGLSSLNILYLATGHNSKIHAISFIPPLIGSIIYSYRKNLLKGSVMLSIFVCLHLSANHIQMTYYMIFLILAILIVEFFHFLKKNLLPKFLKISGVLLLAGILGVIPTISNLIVTYEYSEHTIRGKSELTISANKNESTKTDALDSDYIKRYSLGFGEIWSVAIPNIKGGKSGLLGYDDEIMKKVPSKYQNEIANKYSYWGEQYASGGAFYFGASIFFLFILAMFFVKDKIKWALLSVSVLALILSMKYSSVTDFFINYFPLFSKFRDTKMMLILAQLSFPLLGILFLNHLLKHKIDKKKFLYVTISVSGLFILFYVMPTVFFDFFSYDEVQQYHSQINKYKGNQNALLQLEEINSEISNARESIFKSDVLRSLLYILVLATLVYLLIIRVLKEKAFIAILAIILVFDLWTVDKRYLNNEKKGRKYNQWVDSYKYRNPFQATSADIGILNNELEANPILKQKINDEIGQFKNDKKLKSSEIKIEKEKLIFRELNFATNYRVLALQNPFISSRESYYHKSIGGYHGAKLKNFQEVVEFYIGKEHAAIINILNEKKSIEAVQYVLKNHTPILNMLNTKYLIYNQGAPPIINPFHFGNAWFVEQIKFAENADEEILSLSGFSSFDVCKISLNAAASQAKSTSFTFTTTAVRFAGGIIYIN